MVRVSRISAISPLARVAYHSDGGVHCRRLHRPAVDGEDLTVGTDEPNRLLEPAEPVERLVPPHDRGGRHEVGLDAAGAGGRDQHPVGLGAVAGPRVDDVVDRAARRRARSEPTGPSWPGPRA